MYRYPFAIFIFHFCSVLRYFRVSYCIYDILREAIVVTVIIQYFPFGGVFHALI